MTNLTDMLSKFVNSNTATTSGSGTLLSNTITTPKVDLKGITTQSGVAYQGPTILTTSSPSKVVEREPEVTKDTVFPTNNGSTKDVQPPVVQVQSQVPNSKPVVDPVSTPMPNPKPSIPYPSRRNDEKRREKANNQVEKFYKIFQDMSFEISLADALILMPKFASTLKALIGNKEKLSEMARTPLNEHCSAVILNKLPEKLGDPDKFLIPCDFPGMEECLALADLGASINLMPLSVWKKLSLPELTPTCMTLELADRSITKPIGIAEDVYLKVGKFKFPADFVVVDFDADPRVPLILGRSFLKTGRALIDVYEGELTLRVGKEAITFNLDQTSRYSIMMIIRDFLLEEVDAFLALEDDPTSPEVDDSYYDPEGEKSHFMVKEGIVLGHKISKNGIEVDKAKVDVIAKVLIPLTVKVFGVSIGPKAGFYRWFIKFAKVMLKYGVTHRLSTAYHPQTSRQVEVSNRGLKRILERTIGENHASWSDKLDDALLAFHTTYKTPIECTPYKLVYGKAWSSTVEARTIAIGP
ncbi:reverse transcriptase domain-containing protein [Tanacetum coccineum]